MRISRRVWLQHLTAVLGLVAVNGGVAAATANQHGKILLVRGLMTIFSLGLDDLCEQLRKRKFDAEVAPACLAYSTLDGICRKYSIGELQGPLVLVGHSLGGDLLPGLAQRLEDQRRVVDLLVMIDSTFPSDCPKNVRRCVNLYQSNFSPEWFRVFRGAPIKALNPATVLVNVDIRKLNDHPDAMKLDHFNIEASPWIHDMVVREVAKVIDGPAQETVQATLHPELNGPQRN